MVQLLPEFCVTTIQKVHPICICLLVVSAAILHAWRQSPTSVHSPCLQQFFTPGDSLLHLFTRRFCGNSSRLEAVSYICSLAVSAAVLHAWRQSPTSVHSQCLQLFFTPGGSLLHPLLWGRIVRIAKRVSRLNNKTSKLQFYFRSSLGIESGARMCVGAEYWVVSGFDLWERRVRQSSLIGAGCSWSALCLVK